MQLGTIGMVALRLLAAAVGFYLIISMVLAAIKTFILPRPARVGIVAAVFGGVRLLFDLRARQAESYAERDRVMALYAPIALFLVPIVLLAVMLTGYMLLFWALGGFTLGEAFRLSGSALLTLGNYTNDRAAVKVLEFSAALLGLILVALLIAYLPTMYAAFTRRETQVELLEVRAGSPPSPWEMIGRSYRTGELGQMRGVWNDWQVWFAEIEESHTSLPALNFFRSPRPDLSWITAAGVVLDAAALMLSTVDVAMEPRAAFCIRSGYLALRQIALFFEIPFDADPDPGDPITVTREEFEQAYGELAAQGVPLRPDRDRAWQDFAGWRVNYDAALIALATLTMAPYAPWSSDRSLLHSAATGKRKKRA